MNINLKIFLITICILFIIYIYKLISNKKIEHKMAFSWILLSTILAIFCVFDNLLMKIKDFLGFEVLSNMIFFCGYLFLAILLLSLSIKSSNQSQKIVKLSQEIALLRKEVSNEKNTK